MLYQEDIDRFKNLVVDNDFEALFELLFEAVRQISPLLENELRITQGDYRRMANDYHSQTISRDDYDLEANKLSRSLLYFIDQLPTAKHAGQEKPKNPRYPSGKVLHDIPRQLPLQRVTKCVVRIGETEAIVLDNFTPSPDTQIEDVRIAEVMEVELLDSGGGKYFLINSLNSTEQTIDTGDYSQWIFFVTPLLAGQHDLYLKISVIQLVNGKERKKEIVFERAVEVVSEAIETSPRNWEDTEMRIAGRQTDESSGNSFPGKSIDLGDYLKDKGTHYSIEKAPDAPPSSGSKPIDWASLEPPSMEIGEPSPPPPPRSTPSSGPASAPKPPPSPSPSKGGLSTQPFPKSSTSPPPKKEVSDSPTFGSPPTRRGFRWSRMANLLLIAAATFVVSYYAVSYTYSSYPGEAAGEGKQPDATVDSLKRVEKQDSIRLELEKKAPLDGSN